jgi:hypothetical protein
MKMILASHVARVLVTENCVQSLDPKTLNSRNYWGL